MKETITDLYYGNISPYEQCHVNSQEGHKLLDLLDKNRQKLREGLSEEQRSLLDKYIDCANEMSFVLSRENFIKGFRLGVRLTTEAFSDN